MAWEHPHGPTVGWERGIPVGWHQHLLGWSCLGQQGREDAPWMLLLGRGEQVEQEGRGLLEDVMLAPHRRAGASFCPLVGCLGP